jgi:hypothetical protein
MTLSNNGFQTTTFGQATSSTSAAQPIAKGTIAGITVGAVLIVVVIVFAGYCLTS